MSNGGPHYHLSDDQTKLVIDFPTDPPVRIPLTPAELDEYIGNLLDMRAGMTPEHPTEFQPRGKVSAINDPRWYTEPDMMGVFSLLHIRHPGAGWLSFAIPKPEAAKLAQLLQAQAEEDPRGPGETRM